MVADTPSTPASNVLRFHGAMHPRRALPMPAERKLHEAELDAQITASRERYDEHFEALIARVDQQRRALAAGAANDDELAEFIARQAELERDAAAWRQRVLHRVARVAAAAIAFSLIAAAAGWSGGA